MGEDELFMPTKKPLDLKPFKVSTYISDDQMASLTVFSILINFFVGFWKI